MSGEAILSAENSGKPLGGWGSAPNPAGGAHSTPPDPLAGGEGVAAPLQESHPRCCPLVLPPPQMKILGMALSTRVCFMTVLPTHYVNYHRHCLYVHSPQSHHPMQHPHFRLYV